MTKVTVGADDSPFEQVNKKDWEAKIDYIRDYAWPSFDFTFIDSVEEQLLNHGTLTKHQQSAINTIYEKVQDSQGDQGYF